MLFDTTRGQDLKSLVFLGTAIILFTRLSGQTSRFPSDRDFKIVVELPGQIDTKKKIPVQGIKVIDARFDQTVIGSTTGEYILGNNEVSKKDAVFPDGLSPYLEQKMNSWFEFQPGSRKQLVVLIKKFRAIDNLTRMLTTFTKKEVLFNLDISFFIQENFTCYRLASDDKWYSSDNLQTYTYRVKKDLHSWIITNVLIDKISNLVYKNESTGPSYSWTEFSEGVKKRFDLPVLTEAHKRGIYRTFNEFLLNTPSDTSFVIGLSKENEIVVADSLHRRLNSGNAWGVCDSANCVFFIGKNFYEITSQGYSFRIRTQRVNNIVENITAINDLYHLGIISKKVRKLYNQSSMPDYLDINMDSGELLLEEIIGPYNSSLVSSALRNK